MVDSTTGDESGLLTGAASADGTLPALRKAATDGELVSAGECVVFGSGVVGGLLDADAESACVAALVGAGGADSCGVSGFPSVMSFSLSAPRARIFSLLLCAASARADNAMPGFHGAPTTRHSNAPSLVFPPPNQMKGTLHRERKETSI